MNPHASHVGVNDWHLDLEYPPPPVVLVCLCVATINWVRRIGMARSRSQCLFSSLLSTPRGHIHFHANEFGPHNRRAAVSAMEVFVDHVNNEA